MTVIEIGPRRCGWKAFEAFGVEPVVSGEGSGSQLRAEPDLAFLTCNS
jgi:hypothetical protein